MLKLFYDNKIYNDNGINDVLNINSSSKDEGLITILDNNLYSYPLFARSLYTGIVIFIFFSLYLLPYAIITPYIKHFGIVILLTIFWVWVLTYYMDFYLKFSNYLTFNQAILLNTAENNIVIPNLFGYKKTIPIDKVLFILHSGGRDLDGFGFTKEIRLSIIKNKKVISLLESADINITPRFYQRNTILIETFDDEFNNGLQKAVERWNYLCHIFGK